MWEKEVKRKKKMEERESREVGRSRCKRSKSNKIIHLMSFINSQ